MRAQGDSTKHGKPQRWRRVRSQRDAREGQPGRTRPLGIPTIRDRVVQTAALLVLEPIFDADLSGYFDSIPHAELMKSVARRVSDRHLLHLIEMWLQAPVEETDERGSKRRTTRNKDEGRGCPQGAPISPLLSNLYMRRFVLGWKTPGYDRRLRAKIVNYADDFVICCRGTAQAAMDAMRAMMQKLKLTVNEMKTRSCRVPEDSFDFPGYTLGRCYSPRTGQAYLGMYPSRKKVQAMCRNLSEMTSRRREQDAVADKAAQLNRTLIGWANYFSRGSVSKAYRIVDRHVRHRLRQWLCAKHKVPGQGYARFPDTYLDQVLGLVSLQTRRPNVSCATT